MRLLLSRGIIAGSLLSLAWWTPASAQPALLTRAQVYKVVNQVQVLLSNRPARSAHLSDVLVPQDAVKTAARSRAELLFNEGSVARIGSNAIFRFVPGMRSAQLRNGTALIMSLPQQMATEIETPGGTIVASATLDPDTAPPTPGTPPTPSPAPPPNPELLSLAMAISVDASDEKNIQVKVFSLTFTKITVTDLKGNAAILQGGQFLTIRNGQLGPVQTFDLKAFYKSSQLGLGLGPGQADLILQEPATVQPTLKAVRQATLATLEAQNRWLEGLCTINARGGSSTLATNCITTNTDDPLRAFQDRREVTTPLPPEQPLPPPPPTKEVPPVQPPETPTPPPTPPPPQPPTPPPTPNSDRPSVTVIGPVFVQGGGNPTTPPPPAETVIK